MVKKILFGCLAAAVGAFAVAVGKEVYNSYKSEIKDDDFWCDGQNESLEIEVGEKLEPISGFDPKDGDDFVREFADRYKKLLNDIGIPDLNLSVSEQEGIQPNAALVKYHGETLAEKTFDKGDALEPRAFMEWVLKVVEDNQEKFRDA